MSKSIHYFREDFWKCINSLNTLNQEISVEDFIKNNNLSQALFDHCINFQKAIKRPINILNINQRMIISQLKKADEKETICPIIKGKSHPHHSFIKFIDAKINEVDFIQRLDIACRDSLVINIQMGGISPHLFIPFKLVFIDNELCLIGENYNTHQLSFIQVKDINQFDVKETIRANGKFSITEIEQFIGLIRDLAGTEERLILKIKTIDNINWLDEFNHWGKTYITSSLDGQIIWASSVEVSEKLFQWLYENKNEIEILDPHFFREIFEGYCKFKDMLNKNYNLNAA